MLPFRKLQRGFTLIEMLVVIAIISILIGIGINTFTIAQKKARDVKRKADLATIQKALIAYGLDHNDSYQCGGANCTNLTTLGLVSGGYLSALPTPPTSAASDVYHFWGTTGDFALWVPLENTADKDVAPAKTSWGSSCTGSSITTPMYCIGLNN